MKIKSVFVIIVLVIISSVFAFGQSKTSKGDNDSLQAQLVAMEKQAWEAWKTKNSGFFQTFLSEDSIQVWSGGVDSSVNQVWTSRQFFDTVHDDWSHCIK